MTTTARGTASTAIALAALSLAAIGCKRKPAPTPSPNENETVVESSPAPDAAAPTIAPARCKVDPDGVTLVEGAAAADLEIGEAAITPSGLAIGAFHKVGGDTQAAIALAPTLAAAGAAPSFVDLGPPLGDASPPRPFARGGDLFAAYFPRAQAPASAAVMKGKAVPTRDLAIVRIDGGKAQPALAVSQQRDESLAFDVAASEKSILLAWDEDALGNERGAIKIAMLSPDAKSVISSRIASPDTADAEMPRVLARRGGFWLFYIASRPEIGRDAAPDPSHAIERPGRDREYRWLEMLPLDERGEATGPARKLTSERGHLSLFDIAAREGNAVVDVVAHVDDQLLRLAVKGDAPEPALALVGDAVGRGAPELLAGGDAAWIAYDDPTDKLRLLPLDAARAPAGLPSVEDALDHARPLIATKVAADAIEIVATFPEEPHAQLRRARCAK